MVECTAGSDSVIGGQCSACEDGFYPTAHMAGTPGDAGVGTNICESPGTVGTTMEFCTTAALDVVGG